MQQIIDLLKSIAERFLTQPPPVTPPIIDDRFPAGTVKITAAFPKYTDLSNHKGIDISAKKGAPVYAICDGIVAKTKRGRARFPGASYVIVDNGVEYTVSRHTLPCVAYGDSVKTGELIGHIDKSGNWDGYHYHLEFQDRRGNILEPMAVLNKLQPGLRYVLLKGKYSGGRTVRDIFEKYNPSGLAIIERS